jgi:type VI secretion system protein ImpJ
MPLSPHHFQQAERHLLGEMSHRLAVALPYAWGLRRLVIDEDALGNGRFHVLELDAVMPDGTSIRTPAIDPVPVGRDLATAFTADRARLDVHLALPEERPGTARVRAAPESSAVDSRYRAETLRLADENAPGSETEIAVARANVRILLGGESLDGYATLKIAQLERSSAGVIVRSRDWAPASLSVEAAGPAPSILRFVLESLSAKSDVLKVQTRQVGGKVQYGTSDVMLFWQVHTVNSWIPVIAHYQRTPQAHPFELYGALAQLLGGLCTFASDRHPRDVPPYEHENLGGMFRKMESLFRELIEISEVSRHERIPLERVADALLKGDVGDDRLFGEGYKWFLSVSGPLGEDRIREELPGKITIGSTHNVEFLVRQALRGVPVAYTALPSSDFPIRSGHVYFRLESHGETWDTIREARSIALYLRGAELKELSFELIVTQT